MKSGTAVLRPDMQSKETLEFENQLRAKIVGQDAGIEALLELYQIFCANLNAANRPAGTFLFLGPTGTGKTRLVEAAAEILFGNPRAVVKVDCAALASRRLGDTGSAPEGWAEPRGEGA